MAKWSFSADGLPVAATSAIDASTLSTSGSAEVTSAARRSSQRSRCGSAGRRCNNRDLGARFSSRASRGDNRRDNAPRSTSRPLRRNRGVRRPDVPVWRGVAEALITQGLLYDVLVGSVAAPRAPVAYNRFRRTLARTNKRGQVLDREQLCIIEGQAAWKLRLDLVCVSFAGSLMDAALMAAEAALRDLRLPEPALSDSGQIQIRAEPARGSSALASKSVVAPRARPRRRLSRTRRRRGRFG